MYSYIFICLFIASTQAAHHGHSTPQYGLNLRWVSNEHNCTNPPDAISYWPIGSPFADAGNGDCVSSQLADGGVAYNTYTTSVRVPAIPATWSRFYAEETFWEAQACEEAKTSQIAYTTVTNSNSCIFMGASTIGYYYQRLDCTSATEGLVLSCRDAACTDCTNFTYPGGCDDFVSSVHACAERPIR